MSKKTFVLKILVFFALVVANPALVFSQSDVLTGLRFSSHEAIKDKLTSLIITPKKALDLPKGFTMEFDAKFRPGDGYYGYIFRVIGNNHTNIDLVSNLGSPISTFYLISEDKVLFSYSWDDVPNGAFNSWMKIKLHLDPITSYISLSLNGNMKEKEVKEIAGLHNFNIVFGACKVSPFITTDVSPMTLKNVLIFKGNKNKDVYRNWKLAKHKQNIVLDEVDQDYASVQNPNWEINKHIIWEKEKSLKIKNLIGIAKDEDNGRVFFVNDQAVFIYTIRTSSIDTISYTVGNPFPCLGNQIIYNPVTDELLSYNFYNNNPSKFDFTTKSWTLSESTCEEPDLWHHNSFLSSHNTLITFGGYGHYTYKNVFNRYSIGTKKWEQISTNKIEPRYLSGIGNYKRGKMLIFGGYGSKSGRQELSPQFYYDLYSIDEKDLSSEKLWTLDAVQSPFVPGHSLLTDNSSNSFYALVYNPSKFQTSLTLAQFNIDKPAMKLYSDSIPYNFLDTESWSSLFFNAQDSELIALTSHNSEVDIYSLAYPPILPENSYQQEEIIASSNFGKWAGIILFGLALLVIIAVIQKKRVKISGLKKKPLAGGKNELYSSQRVEVAVPKKKGSSIYLLGGFQVYDKDANDITSSFTPTLKQLFLLIFLTSVKNGKGISSSKLNEILWFDKTDESARNNRNVNISKLRILFKSIDHIDLEYNSTHWKITFGDDLFSDYVKAMQLIQKSRSALELQEDEVLHLIQLASTGDLCPNIQTEWIDKFKADFSNDLIDTFTILLENLPDSPNKNYLLSAITDCILKFDILNENAIATKCSILYQSGKKSLAKQTYDIFCREYKHMLGDDFSVSFKDTVRIK